MPSLNLEDVNNDSEGYIKQKEYHDIIPKEWCLACEYARCVQLSVSNPKSCPYHPEHEDWVEKDRQLKRKGHERRKMK